jgi:arylamine N-acetyltransferase
LTVVPFENISKLYFRDDETMRLPGLDRYLDGIEFNRFGGTCYANNYHFSRLLAFLGFDVRICGADMSTPDAHLVCVVTLEGTGYLVDSGYGAPFLTPMPLDLARDQEILLGSDRYILHPKNAEGWSAMEMHRNGKLRHGYRVNPRPRRIEEFTAVIQNSFRESATFMNAAAIARFQQNKSLVLNNLTLVESSGLETRIDKFDSPKDLPEVIEVQFGIPANIARQALSDLPLSKNIWE